jgi:hypothetical protein
VIQQGEQRWEEEEDPKGEKKWKVKEMEEGSEWDETLVKV